MFQVLNGKFDGAVETIELVNTYNSFFRLVRIRYCLHICLGTVLFCRVHFTTDEGRSYPFMSKNNVQCIVTSRARCTILFGMG